MDLQTEVEAQRASIWGSDKIRGYYTRGLEAKAKQKPSKRRRRAKDEDSDSEDIYADPAAKEEDAPITKLAKKKKTKKPKTDQQAQTERLTLHVSVPRGVTRLEVMEVFQERGFKKCDVKEALGTGGRYALVQMKTEEALRQALELNGTCPEPYNGQSIAVSQFRTRRQGKKHRNLKQRALRKVLGK
eukprot:GGOE01036205.1.p1 GENE.GGOE01036205.1~~GGOE01036205.1.p1  ORF type:complete len:187 (-),score=67.50 GGOE01036205.1:378-938(-)